MQKPQKTVQGCPFCIKNGKVTILNETEDAYLVVAINSDGIPMQGRYLIIPKQHIESILDLPVNWQNSVAELLRLIPEVQEGAHFNLSYNQGSVAGQRVPHVHGWVIIRHIDEAEGSRGIGLASLINKAAKAH
ncbi:HIT domain-containing protein [Candidatus Nomurabacteria bacterium]|nr:HIT domain-containing protein [Candidatus Nomurabacteria bacterium]